MITDEINALKSKNLIELRELYKRYFGRDGATGNKEFYVSRIAYRMQEAHYGGLPSSVRFLIENMKVPKDNSKGSMTVGSSIIKDYKGKLYKVMVLNNAFELNGQVYGSLSAVAGAITGQRISGKFFFNIKDEAR